MRLDHESNVKVGDLVLFRPTRPVPGALTAVKYLQRMKERWRGRTGLVIHVSTYTSQRNIVVQVEDDCIVINGRYLEVISE